jgi:hypothetical protein
MQNNKIIQLAIIGVTMLLSIWAVSALLEARDTSRNVILGIGFFLVLIFSLWKKMAIDAKLLLIIIMGYALGGKGFGYLSPFEPVYIGEICLALCLCGLVLRLNRAGLADTTVHKLIWVYLIYGGIHLIIDYSQYRLLAIRDSSMVYYSLYFVVTYSLLQNETIMGAFERIIKLAVIFSVISMAYRTLGLPSLPGMHPHPDAFMPFNVAAVLYYLVKGREDKKIFYIVFAIFVAFTLVTSKTAALVSLVMVLAAAVMYGRVRGLFIPSMIMAASAMLALMVVTFVNPHFILETIGSGDTAETFGLEGGEFVGVAGTTTEWRLDWWSLTWTNTMNIAPFWGQGFGADITGPFLEAWLGPEYSDATGYARFPHCVLFTNIGRLGLIGLFIFSMLFIALGLMAMKFSKRYFNSPDRWDADLIVYGVVVAGMVNGLLQATYEIPHGAITHWVCLGYIAVRYYKPITSAKEQDSISEM